MKTCLIAFTTFIFLYSPDATSSFKRHRELRNFNRNISFLSQHHLNDDLVDKWFRYYTGRGKKLFERQLQRGEEVRKVVENVFLEKNMPLELYYVGLIESGFNFQAKSHAKATGPWQFMKKTAIMYGLRVDDKVDERYNIYKSTKAAAEYLSDLYNIFDDWALTLAAYNAGEYRILSAIRKSNTRDFNKLIEMGAIPSETMNYISKVWTAMIVDKNAGSFQVNKNAPSYLLNPLELTLSLDQNVDVSKLVELSGLSSKKFKKYNAHLLKDKIEAGSGVPVEIYLPRRSYMKLALGLYGFKRKPTPRIVPVLDPKKLSGYGFKNLSKGEEIEVTKLDSGQIKLKRMKTGRIIMINSFKN